MNLLLKHSSCIIILFSTFVAHSSSEENSCQNAFSSESKLNELNNFLKEIMQNRNYKLINNEKGVEHELYNIINNREFLDTINKKNSNDRKKAWLDIESNVKNIMTEKMSQIFFKNSNYFMRKLAIFTLKRLRPVAGDKHLQMEFLRLYTDNLFFKEWFLKIRAVVELQHIIGVPVKVLTQLEQSLLEEVEDAPIGKQIHNEYKNVLYTKNLNEIDNKDLIKWVMITRYYFSIMFKASLNHQIQKRIKEQTDTD